MAGESKVQKVARQAAAQKTTDTCGCGGNMLWAKLVQPKPRMVKICEKCGAVEEREPA